MGAKLDVADRVKIAADLSYRAQVFHATWFGIASRDGRAKYAHALDEHAEVLIMAQAAHMVALVCALHSLFERSVKTVNLPAIDAELGGIAGDLIEEAQVTAAKVAKLRHNLFAHRSGRLTQAEIYRLAAITPDDLRWLAIKSSAIVRRFCDHLELEVPVDADHARSGIESLLDAVSRDVRRS